VNQYPDLIHGGAAGTTFSSESEVAGSILVFTLLTGGYTQHLPFALFWMDYFSGQFYLIFLNIPNLATARQGLSATPVRGKVMAFPHQLSRPNPGGRSALCGDPHLAEIQILWQRAMSYTYTHVYHCFWQAL